MSCRPLVPIILILPRHSSSAMLTEGYFCLASYQKCWATSIRCGAVRHEYYVLIVRYHQRTAVERCFASPHAAMRGSWAVISSEQPSRGVLNYCSTEYRSMVNVLKQRRSVSKGDEAKGDETKVLFREESERQNLSFRSSNQVRAVHGLSWYTGNSPPRSSRPGVATV